MLNHISPVFSPELLAAVYAMGHGDTIVLADGNFPSDGVSRRGAAEIIRADDHGIPELLDAILALMPLDTYAEKPVLYMAKSECDRDLALPILDEYKKIIEKYDERGEACTGYLERYAFYDKAEQASCRAARPHSMRTSSCRRASSSGISDCFFSPFGASVPFWPDAPFSRFRRKRKKKGVSGIAPADTFFVGSITEH